MLALSLQAISIVQSGGCSLEGVPSSLYVVLLTVGSAGGGPVQITACGCLTRTVPQRRSTHPAATAPTDAILLSHGATLTLNPRG